MNGRNYLFAIFLVFISVAGGCSAVPNRDVTSSTSYRQIGALPPPVTETELDAVLNKIYNQADYLAYIEVEVTLIGENKNQNEKITPWPSVQQMHRLPYFSNTDVKAVPLPFPKAQTPVDSQDDDQSAAQNPRIRTVTLSGFLWSSDERYYVVTAGHIRNPGYAIMRVMVWFKDYETGGPYEARLIGYQADRDVALLLIIDPDFKFSGNDAVLGDSQNLKVTDFTYGRIADFVDDKDYDVNGREIKLRYIMHEANIDYGNSGGPLIDMGGKVIGM
ncbi:MAG: serine protease [bacterium]|nr:serine protease [bacterium]